MTYSKWSPSSYRQTEFLSASWQERARRDIAETQNITIDGRGTDNSQLMPVIKHQWQIAHAKRPCQLSKWYLRRVCIIQRAAISAASWKMHVDLSRVDRMDRSEMWREVCFLFCLGIRTVHLDYLRERVNVRYNVS